MRQRIGELFIGLGIFHLVVVGVLGHKQLGDIVATGLVDGVSGSIEREAAFWAFFLGVPILQIGLITRWAQRQSGTLPASLGWATAIGGLLGWIVILVSGFPLVVALGLYIARVARQETLRAADGRTPAYGG